MIDPVFVLNAKIALSVQENRISLGNRIYGFLVEGIVRGHKDYEKLLTLRKDKKADRKKTATFTKKLLKERLEEIGLSPKQFTERFDATKKSSAIYTLVLEAEHQAFKDLKPLLKKIPLWAWIKSVKGLGLNFGVKLLCNLRDVKRFPNPSKLRKYCGTAPGTKLRQGQEANFNPELKGILLGQIAKNFLMSNSQYRQVYDRKKAKYQERYSDELEKTEKKKTQKQKITKDDWTKMRIHNYAQKAMINRFLIELWQAAYLVERKEPPTNPYILNDPKHNKKPMIVPITENMKVPTKQKPETS